MQAFNIFPFFSTFNTRRYFLDFLLLFIIISLFVPAVYKAYSQTMLSHYLLTTVGAPVYECVQ